MNPALGISLMLPGKRYNRAGSGMASFAVPPVLERDAAPAALRQGRVMSTLLSPKAGAPPPAAEGA